MPGNFFLSLTFSDTVENSPGKVYQQFFIAMLHATKRMLSHSVGSRRVTRNSCFGEIKCVTEHALCVMSPSITHVLFRFSVTSHLLRVTQPQHCHTEHQSCVVLLHFPLQDMCSHIRCGNTNHGCEILSCRRTYDVVTVVLQYASHGPLRNCVLLRNHTYVVSQNICSGYAIRECGSVTEHVVLSQNSNRTMSGHV